MRKNITDKDLLQVWGEKFLNAYTKPNHYFFIRKLESIISNQFLEVLQDTSRIPNSNVLIQVFWTLMKKTKNKQVFKQEMKKIFLDPGDGSFIHFLVLEKSQQL